MADKGRHLLVKKVGAQSKQGPRLFVRTEDLSNAPGESLDFINLCLTGTVCTSLGDALVKNAVLVAEVSKGIGSVRVYCHPPKENSELNLDSCVPGWVRAVDEAKEMPTMCISCGGSAQVGGAYAPCSGGGSEAAAGSVKDASSSPR